MLIVSPMSRLSYQRLGETPERSTRSALCQGSPFEPCNCAMCRLERADAARVATSPPARQPGYDLAVRRLLRALELAQVEARSNSYLSAEVTSELSALVKRLMEGT
jgi:hypothetical protein